MKDNSENLSELLAGDRIENSPSRFKMKTNGPRFFYVKPSLFEFKLMKERIYEMYQVNVIPDNSPAIRILRKLVFT